MPELHKLTPTLGVLQDRGSTVALVTDGRMSGASGKVPAAIHVTPEALCGGPIARAARRRPRPPRHDRRHARGAGRRGRVERARARDGGPGRAPFGTRARAVRALPRRGRPGRRRRQHLRRPVMSEAMAKRQQALAHTLGLGPVVAVVVIERLADAVPMARALVAGGVRAIEVTLRTPVALDAMRAIAAEVEGAHVGAGTVITPADFAAAERAGARFAVSPGATATLVAAARGLRAAVVARRRDRLRSDGGAGTRPSPSSSCSPPKPRAARPCCAAPRPLAGPALLSHRRHHPGQRRQLPRAAQRRLRRRLLAHPGRPHGRRRLAPHRGPGPRGQCLAPVSRFAGARPVVGAASARAGPIARRARSYKAGSEERALRA